MKIIGLETMGTDEINIELQKGGKFVIYQYCISLFVITFKRPSNIYFVKADESAVVKSLPFTAISLFLGWWGIPWGPIYTVGSFITNFQGGKDVTNEVLRSLNQNN